MARFELPFVATMALCAGPVMFARGFRDLRTRRLIRNTPTARIRSMSMGLVEINGTVLERSVVRAPFSGRECAYWEVEIALRVSRRGGHRILHRKNSGNPFYVDDGTGVALVYPGGSVCRTPVACEEDCQGLFVPEPYSGYMSEQRLWQRHFLHANGLRFRERTIEEGQRVYILGTAVPRASSRDISNPVLAETPAEAAAWVEPEARATGTYGAGSSARIPARGRERMATLHDRISAVVRRGESDTTFIISTESQLALEIEYGAAMLAKLLGGPLLTILGLGYWMDALGRH